MEHFEEFEENVESSSDELADFLEACAYAGRTTDERLDRLVDRQFRATDGFVNGIIGNALFEQEVLRRVNFRGAEPANG